MINAMIPIGGHYSVYDKPQVIKAIIQVLKDALDCKCQLDLTDASPKEVMEIHAEYQRLKHALNEIQARLI